MRRWAQLPELCEYLGGVPASYVYSRTKRGSSDPIPAYRAGGKLLVDLDEIDRWVEAHRVEQPRQDWSQNLKPIRNAEDPARDRVPADVRPSPKGERRERTTQSA